MPRTWFRSLGFSSSGENVFVVVFLFWLENAVVGFLNALRMLWVEHGAERMPAAKIALIPFFLVDYGLFTAVHGVFVFALFGRAAEISGLPSAANVVDVIVQDHLWMAVLALMLSHGYSFVRNYVAAQEYRRVTLRQLMSQPYSRIVVLHLTILGCGFLVMALQLPVVAILMLVGLKIWVDLHAHLREHRKLQPAPAQAQFLELGA